MTAFEDGLWTRLVDEHDADRASLPARRTHRAKRPLIGGGVAVAIAAAAAIAITALSGPAPAYALTRNANGTITLSIYEWSRVNIRQINARFASMGSRWHVVPVTAPCATRWPPKPDYGYDIVSSTARGAQTGTVTPGPTLAAFPGVWVIAVGQQPDGQMAFATFNMARPMPKCLPPAALVPTN